MTPAAQHTDPPFFPNGIPIAFGATGGTITPASALTQSGNALSSFISTTVGTATVSATLDNQTVSLSFMVTPPPTTQADLAVFKSGSNPTPNVGDTITYTITLDNGGPDPATGVVVGDTLPTGVTYVSSSASQGAYDPTTHLWTVGDVKVATPQTLVITATVVSAAPIANTASIAKSDQFDPYEGNNSDTTSIVPQQADLGLVKSVDDPRPNVGETVTFTVFLVNSGPAAATGVVVADPLPAGLQFVGAKPSQGTYDSTTGTWTVGGVAVGAPQTLTITAKVVNPAREANTATITHADQFDPAPSNNIDSATVTPPSAPTVTNLQRFGFHHQPTALVLTFDRPLDPARAELTSNYRLVALFHGGRLRVPVAIASAVYDPTQNTVTLTPKLHGRPFLPLHREYELTVVGTGGSGVTAADGTPLAGRGGVPGTDAVRQFRFEILAGSNRPGAPHKPFERPDRHTDSHGQAGVHRVQLRHGSRAVHVR